MTCFLALSRGNLPKKPPLSMTSSTGMSPRNKMRLKILALTYASRTYLLPSQLTLTNWGATSSPPPR